MERQIDCMSLYLRDVRKSRVLTPEEEIELAKRIQAGDKEAEKTLIEANLKFVVSTARKYQHLGMPIEDLISEGNYGLIKAAQRFDYSRGYKFISYAVWWIKQAILLSINENSSTIRIPINVRNEIAKQKKEEPEFRCEDEQTQYIFDNEVIENKIPKLTSMNQHINEDGDELSAFIVDELPFPDEKMQNFEMDLNDALVNTMSCLDSREKQIIIEYYGLGELGAKTLEMIGEDMEITKERVRQIKDKAIQKLRNNSHALFQFFD